MRSITLLLLGMAAMLILVAFPGPVQAATLTVTKTDDTFDGVCDADCSLREAIGVADPGDSIDIPAGEFTLSLGVQITFGKNLTLTGAGAENTIIQADANPGTASFRIFNITSGDVSISGVTIRHGKVSGTGGAITNNGNLMLVESVVSDNSATANGGGIYSTGTLTVIESVVSDNSTSSDGGGISGILALTRSTVSDNTGRRGGGIYGAGTFNNSTISNNVALGFQTRGGGGLFATTNTTMTNVTIAENSTGLRGGGIYRNSGTVELINTLLAKNTAPTGPDCYSSITSLGHNFIGFPVNCSFVPDPSDVTGTVDIALDPNIGPLQDNGGPTETHALLPGSLAIDAGDDVAAPATDQRGVVRPQIAASDIGAYEYQLPGEAPIAVDDSYDVAHNTLRTVPVPGVLDNDSDGDGDPMTASLVGDVSNGTLNLGADGSFTYMPDPGFGGTDEFSYVAKDALRESNLAVVTLNVGHPRCTLDLSAGYSEGNLDLDFLVGSLEPPVTWGVWLLIPDAGVFEAWSIPLAGFIDPPFVVPTISFALPQLGTIGVLTVMTAPVDGIVCSAWATVDTGSALSGEVTIEGLRGLIPEAANIFSGN